MAMALQIKNMIGFINGTSQRPTEDQADERQQWDRCDILVKTWLGASMSNPIAKSVMHCKSARAVWLELQERFMQSNTVQLFNIENEIHGCEQGTDSVTTFFTKLKALWDERDAFCDLSPCACEEGGKLSEYVKNQKTMKFLMGLNENYAQMRGTIVAIKPLLAVNKAYSMVLRHEKQAEAAMGSKQGVQQQEAAAFAVRGSDRDNSRDNGRSNSRAESAEGSKPKCEKCNKSHLTENCRQHLKCTFCGWKGHTYDTCRRRKAIADRNSRSNHVASMFKDGNSVNFPFSKEECK
uniref:uncharacterized protein LOC105351914 n=1 Tax=Fragaria vesca subsp. vesca TaxID=101020 RepID=UPI0005C9D411|nr:PREDICTED: uncharacterized protein LOC105351914 [Fragaria vesca subsp. vesca]